MTLLSNPLFMDIIHYPCGALVGASTLTAYRRLDAYDAKIGLAKSRTGVTPSGTANKLGVYTISQGLS
jgi:hypothetical protein